jgi:hypothetical protein
MHGKELAINDAIVQQAEIDAPQSGYETRQFYTLATDDKGKPLLQTVDSTSTLASNAGTTTSSSSVNAVPQRSGYNGYLLGNGFPSNGYDFGFGIQFPTNPQDNDFFLRVDFLPNRLFRFSNDQSSWIAVEDALRMNMTNNDSRSTLKTGFINNDNNYIYFDAVTDGGSYVTLSKGDTVIDTFINSSITGTYLMLKL